MFTSTPALPFKAPISFTRILRTRSAKGQPLFPPIPTAPPPWAASHHLTHHALALLFPQTSPLRWAWQHAVYTDGSCVPDPHGGPNRLGAAFYDGPDGATYLVDPAGQGSTNTITRAELGAIDQALAHAGLRPGPLTIFSDSLASLHLIRTATTSPASLWECKHRDLLHSITDRLVSRCSLGLATSLCKVKAHSGIQGNELADRGATAALAPRPCHPHLHGYCR